MSDDLSRGFIDDVKSFFCEKVSPSGSRYGLVIGIDKHRCSKWDLNCAVNDANDMYRLMIDPNCGMFEPNKTKILQNAKVTHAAVRSELSALVKKAKEKDAVWIYFAGHAALVNGHTHLILYESDENDIYGTGFCGADFVRLLKDIKAKRLVLFLDCCHAKAVLKDGLTPRAVPTPEELFASFKGCGRVGICASKDKEKAIESTADEHGLFTKCLIEGLRGAADANRDGVVTFAELFAYVDGEKKEYKSQTIVRIGEDEQGFPLTLNKSVIEDREALSVKCDSLIGRGSDKLSTDEAEFCVKVLYKENITEHEETLIGYIREIGEQSFKIARLKSLIKAAKPISNTPEVYPVTSSEKYELVTRDAPKAQASKPRPKQRRRVAKGLAAEITNVIGMKLKLIQPGSFVMGSDNGEPDEKPLHKVTISKHFYIGIYPVTQDEYFAIMKDNPSHFKGDGRRPVEGVTWQDANKFCAKLSDKDEKLVYRLPTEAEWEYCCRAGTSTAYYWGDEVDSLHCWFFENSDGETHPVGSLLPNPWGLFDMLGNVWEWCMDRYGEYQSVAETDPHGPICGKSRVLRGGSLGYDASFCRGTCRGSKSPTYRSSDDALGFRVVASPRTQ